MPPEGKTVLQLAHPSDLSRYSLRRTEILRLVQCSYFTALASGKSSLISIPSISLHRFLDLSLPPKHIQEWLLFAPRALLIGRNKASNAIHSSSEWLVPAWCSVLVHWNLLFVPSEGSEAPLHPHPVNRHLFVVVGYIILPAPSNKNLLTTQPSALLCPLTGLML